MKVSPKYLAYGSVLAIGAIALALDSAFPPASAAASVGPPVAESTANALASAAAAYSAPVDTGLAPLADRLAQLNERHAGAPAPERDVFEIDRQAWGLQSEVQAPKPEPSASPSTTLRLTAIVSNGMEGRAVINGMLVGIGGYVAGGYRVERIGTQSVTLDLDGHTVTLRLENPRQ